MKKEFTVSPKARSEAWRRAILGDGDGSYSISLTAGQRRALAAHRARLAALRGDSDGNAAQKP